MPVCGKCGARVRIRTDGKIAKHSIPNPYRNGASSACPWQERRPANPVTNRDRITIDEVRA